MGVLAAFIIAWILASYVIIGVTDISINYGIGTYTPLSISYFGPLGTAMQVTVKYIFGVLFVLLAAIISIYTHRIGVFFGIAFFGIVIGLLTYGGVI